MIQILAILREPFPGTSNPMKEIRDLFFIGLFVTGFLYVFEPFGLNNHQGRLLLLCSLFGSVTFLVGLIYFLFLFYVLKLKQDEPSWTFGKWIIYALGMVLMIGLGNYLLNSFLMNDFLQLDLLPQFLGNTLAIGIFPIVISGLISTLRGQKRNAQLAHMLHPGIKGHDPQDRITIPVATSQKSLEFELRDVFYLEAMQNYVAIHYQDNSGPGKELVRNTITAVENELPECFMRCHRSYIVNLLLVADVKGNAQGLILQFKDQPEGFSVPVSRKYIPLLRDRMS